MVSHMMLLEIDAHLPMEAEVVNCVMGKVIGKITRDEPCKERREITSAKYFHETEVEHDRERYADYRRHNESRRVVRIVMVNAMEHEMDFLPPSAFRDEVEHEPVKDVFGETPDENADHEEGKDVIDAESEFDRPVEHQRDYREVNDSRNGRMHMRQELEKVILEHPYRFITVRNVQLHDQTPSFDTNLME